MAFLLNLFLALLAVACYLVVVAIQTRNRLSAFHGPFLASISESWLFWQSIRHRVGGSNQALLNQYGDYARIGPNLLITSNPELLRHMSAPRSTWTRSHWYSLFKFDSSTDNVFSTRDEKQHSYLRSKLGPAYSGRAVSNLESSVQNQVQNLLRYVDSYAASAEKRMDMVHMAHYFTLDVLSQIAFGEAFGFLEADTDLYDYCKTGYQFFPILELALNHQAIFSIINHPWVSALLAPKDSDQFGQGRIIRIARKAIAARYASKDEQKSDMIGHMIAQKLSDQQAMSEAGLQVLAGSDSTSSSIRATMLKIVTNHLVYTKLQREIDDHVTAQGLAPTSIIQDVDARQLPYLQAVIWEGLRVSPPLFGLQTKVAPLGGDTVNGVFFPGGVHVAFCPSALTMRKDIFGQDSDLFRPERWIEADEVTRAKYLSTVELIFGSGRYGCLGRNIGLLELNKVYFEVSLLCCPRMFRARLVR
nr:cytochrome p450 monooxygenase mpade [Quercus suber]